MLQSSAGPEGSRTAGTVDRPRVLVVDDSRVVRRALTRILGDQFEIIEAEDGWVGWRSLKNDSRIDAVITDIQMPNLDGYTFICKIRAAEDPGLRALPVVVITSSEDDVTRDRAYACGANDFILKPFNSTQLMGCLSNTVKDYQVKTEAAAESDEQGASRDGIKTAVAHFDAGLKILRSLDTVAIAPHALLLSLRLVSLLKYCNSKFGLNLENEIEVIQARLSAARENIEVSEVSATRH